MTGAPELLLVARQAVQIALEVLGTKPAGRLTSKGDRDVATEVDYEIEDRVRNFLHRETPHIGFFGEEGGGSSGAGEQWVLDPLDGTSNFVHGVPVFAVSLALVRSDEPVLGLVSIPSLDLHYCAQRGRGAQCNSQAIRASATGALDQAMVSLGDYAVGAGSVEKNADRLAVTTALAAQVERIRMIGSAAIDLVWVAHGKLDAAIILSNNSWDTAAGTLIAREAGAATVDRFGEPHSTRSSTTIAVAPLLKDKLLSLLAQ